MRQLGLLGVLLAALPASIFAQSTSTVSRVARGTLTIFKPLSITNTADLSFGRLQPQGNGTPGTVILTSAPPIQRIANGVSALPGGTETPAIRTLAGEPGRIYRVTIPSSVTSSPNAYLINSFTLWTQNRGDVTSTRVGQFNSNGTDVLRVGAMISLPKGSKQAVYTANVPITITYE